MNLSLFYKHYSYFSNAYHSLFRLPPLQQPPKYQQLFRPLGGGIKLTDSSKFKVTVKSDTDIHAIVFFVCFFLFCLFCFVHFLFILFLSIVFFFLFFVFFVFFCLFFFISLIYVHVTVYTYKPGHSILRSLEKSV